MRGSSAAGALAVLVALLLSGCAAPGGQAQADRLSPPRLGSCRVLTPQDVRQPSNSSPVVPCSARHTAETFAIGTLPASTGSSYDDRRHGRWIYHTCQQRFDRFLGADESLALRIRLSWAWFRPSQDAWGQGARWYRCDVVGGPDGARSYRPLPTTARGLFSKQQPNTWLTCARGATVTGSVKVPCSARHDWRAVTAVKVGQPGDPYPGDRIVQVRSRDYCSDWVGAWMHYPTDYEFGYTWFHRAEWQAGNRRSVCWARTDR
ncbi:MAG TPA: septum formation family protein [Segeticoccus sp.]|nr:septum formation family protein [Segeticoccus sp.]